MTLADQFERVLTDRIKDEISQRAYGPEELAEHAGVLPSGAQVLLKRDRWDLDTALRVADALGCRVEASLVER